MIEAIIQASIDDVQIRDFAEIWEEIKDEIL